MHMHMAMAWRAEAAVDELDIADKLGCAGAFVKPAHITKIDFIYDRRG